MSDFEPEDAAMMFVKQEPSDDSIRFAEELRDTRVKMEVPEMTVKREPSPVPGRCMSSSPHMRDSPLTISSGQPAIGGIHSDVREIAASCR